MRASTSAAIAMAALLAATGAQAQSAPPPPSAAPAAHMGWDPAKMQARMQARREARLHALHTVLGIRPDQEGAFSAFAAAMTPPAMGAPGQGWGLHRQDGEASAMTTPERLDHMAQMMQQRTARHEAMFQRRAEATKALYSALSPEQRQVMDALPMLRGGHDEGKGRGMGGHGWGGQGGRGPGMGGPEGQG